MCAVVVRELERQDQGPDLTVYCKHNRVIFASQGHCGSRIACLNVSDINWIHQSLNFRSGSLEFDICMCQKWARVETHPKIRGITTSGRKSLISSYRYRWMTHFGNLHAIYNMMRTQGKSQHKGPDMVIWRHIIGN